MRRLVAALALSALPTVAVAQSENDGLQVAAHQIAQAWGRASVDGVVRHVASAGVSIDVADGPMGPLNERQASALLRQLFEEGETVAVQQRMLERVGGQPPRAFAAIVWTTRPRGTRLPVRRMVYFGLDRIDGFWRISEIRLIR